MSSKGSFKKGVSTNTKALFREQLGDNRGLSNKMIDGSNVKSISDYKESFEHQKPRGNMLLKRLFDLTCAGSGLLLISPLLVLIALWIKIDSPGPIFFRQVRIGKKGKAFKIFKFRTMVNDAEKMGKHFTVGDDSRITPSGHFLRKSKLDELPQLINVILGEMSLVGPRPQVPKHVEEYPKKIKEVVLSVPPGITEFSSLVYINENELLNCVENPEDHYREKIIPMKLYYYMKYVCERSLWLDIKLIFLTITTIVKSKIERSRQANKSCEDIQTEMENLSKKLTS